MSMPSTVNFELRTSDALPDFTNPALEAVDAVLLLKSTLPRPRMALKSPEMEEIALDDPLFFAVNTRRDCVEEILITVAVIV